MDKEKTYWNGLECYATKVKIIVGKAKKSTYWYAGLEGEKRSAVRVNYFNDEPFYLDNEDGSGWKKVTTGKGSPWVSHKEISIAHEY